MEDDGRHHRRSVRREGYDYRDGGMYYVTICTDQRECVFGEIRHGIMGLNEWGSIVAECWMQIPDHFPGTAIDEFIVMPNHMHGILYLDDPEFRQIRLPDRSCRGMACHAPTTAYANTLINGSMSKRAMPLPGRGTNVHPNIHNEWTGERHFSKPIAGSLSTIIGSFKSAVTKRINDQRDAPGEPVWQRNFYEHIIRKPDALDRIRSYILLNPRTWRTDDEYNDE